MAVIFFGGGNRSTGKKPHNVVSSTPPMSGIRTHNVSGDMHWMRR